MHPWKYEAALGFGKQRFIAFFTKQRSVRRHVVSCQIRKISNQQKTACQRNNPMISKCAATMMEILNKLCAAVFAGVFHSTVMCCLLSFQEALKAVRKHR